MKFLRHILLGILPAFAIMYSPESVSAQDVISGSSFRDAVKDKILQTRPSLCVKAQDARTLSVGLSEDVCDDIVLSIDGKYSQYLTDEENKELYIKSLSDLAIEAMRSSTGQDIVLEKSKLTVVLRHEEYHKYLGDTKDEERSIWKPFTGDLIALLVHDNLSSIKSVTKKDLDFLKLSETEAWETATVNLPNLTGELYKESNQGAEYVTSENGLATGLLWHPNTCKEGGINFDSLVVDKHSYIFADMKDSEATSLAMPQI
jgi:hypothetical protein